MVPLVDLLDLLSLRSSSELRVVAEAELKRRPLFVLGGLSLGVGATLVFDWRTMRWARNVLPNHPEKFSGLSFASLS